MAVDQAQKFCKQCQQKTLHERHRTSEMWGCLLTLLTAGLWIPVWFLMSLFSSLKGYRCQQCGREN